MIRRNTMAKWPISERADGIENPKVPPSKRYLDNLQAEERMKKWNAEHRAKREKKP
jgi:hypothetical protein